MLMGWESYFVNGDFVINGGLWILCEVSVWYWVY